MVVSCKHNDVMNLKNLGCPIKCVQLMCKKTKKKPKKINFHAVENKKLKHSVKTLKKNNNNQNRIIRRMHEIDTKRKMKMLNKNKELETKQKVLMQRNKYLGKEIERVRSHLNDTSLPAPGHPEQIQEPINVDKVVQTLLSNIPERIGDTYDSPENFGWGKKRFKKKTVRKRRRKRTMGKKRTKGKKRTMGKKRTKRTKRTKRLNRTKRTKRK